MINLLASFANTDGAAFPLTLGINASGAGAGDGTEFVKLFVDDLWGARQALLDAAGLTPDGATETVGTSQLLEAIRKISGSPGEGVIWFKDDDPSVTGDRVILLTGQAVLIANYIPLDAAVYVGDAKNPTASSFFRTSDAGGTIRNVAGPYLVLGEGRGYALRGLDIAAAVDPDGASRDMGSLQLDAMQRITGNTVDGGMRTLGSPSFNPTGVFSKGATTINNTSTDLNGTALLFDNNDSTTPNAAKTDDVESRMVNIACSFGIRY